MCDVQRAGAYLRAELLVCTLLRDRIGACRVLFGPISFRWGERRGTERDLVERRATFGDLNLVCALWVLAERWCRWLAESLKSSHVLCVRSVCLVCSL